MFCHKAIFEIIEGRTCCVTRSNVAAIWCRYDTSEDTTQSITLWHLVTRDWARRILLFTKIRCGDGIFGSIYGRETNFWQETENGNDSFSLFSEKMCSHQNRGKAVDLMTANSQWPLLLCQQFRLCRCLRIACKALRLMRKSLSTRQSLSSCVR